MLRVRFTYVSRICLILMFHTFSRVAQHVMLHVRFAYAPPMLRLYVTYASIMFQFHHDNDIFLCLQETWYEQLIRYGLYIGAVFQMICILVS